MNTQFIKYLLTTTLQGHAPSPHLDVTLMCTNIRPIPGQFLSLQTFLLLNQTISGTGTEPGQLKEVHTRSGRCRGKGDEMALLALNKPRCVSDFVSWGGYPRPQSSSSVPVAQGSWSWRLNPPAMNLLEQKRVWDGDEENTGVYSTAADS